MSSYELKLENERPKHVCSCSATPGGAFTTPPTCSIHELQAPWTKMQVPQLCVWNDDANYMLRPCCSNSPLCLSSLIREWSYCSDRLPIPRMRRTKKSVWFASQVCGSDCWHVLQDHDPELYAHFFQGSNTKKSAMTGTAFTSRAFEYVVNSTF